MCINKINTFFNLTEQEYKLLVLKCNSEVRREEYPLSKIVKSILRYINCFFRNKNNHRLAKNVLVLNGELYKEYFDNSQRFHSIIKKNADLLPFNINLCKLNISEACKYTTRLIKLIYIYRIGIDPERSLIRKIAVDYFLAEISTINILKHQPQKVIFYGGSYYLTYFFMSLLLKRLSIKTNMYLGSPILTNSDLMFLDKIILFHKWQIDNCKKFILVDNYEIGKSQDYHLVPNYNNNPVNKSNSIAIYSSGIYERFKLNFHDYDILLKFLANELLLKKLLINYSKKFSSLNFKIFLHKGIESFDSAFLFYEDLLENKNVQIIEEFNSQKFFNNFEIGISNISATLFERLDGGHKSCFVFPEDRYDMFQNTELKNITIYDFFKAIDKIEYLRKLPRQEFFHKINYTEVL